MGFSTRPGLALMPAVESRGALCGDSKPWLLGVAAGEDGTVDFSRAASAGTSSPFLGLLSTEVAVEEAVLNGSKRGDV